MLKRWIIGLGVLALVVVAVVVGVRLHRVGPLLSSEGCEARVGGHSVSLSMEQAENVALMAAISVQRGMPARAATIAIATSAQESKLYNVEHGDRDSLGLFQQRPSQGWGTAEQILNPYYSINTFYDALAKVDGYESMKITEAAQLVQRSAFPEAYAEHEADARVLASALTGNSPRAFTCVVDDDGDEAPDRLVKSGLTRRADVVRRDIGAAFGELSLGGFAPGGVRSGHQPSSTDYEVARSTSSCARCRPTTGGRAGRSRSTSSPRPTGSSSRTSSSTTGSGPRATARTRGGVTTTRRSAPATLPSSSTGTTSTSTSSTDRRPRGRQRLADSPRIPAGRPLPSEDAGSGGIR